jgi:DNA polymerase-3 subunit delta
MGKNPARRRILLHILIGEDDYSVRQALEEIRKGVSDPSALAANTAVFDGQVPLAQLTNACATVPFLAEKRLVIVEGLLARFESGAKNGRKKARKNGQEDEAAPFVDALKQIPPFTDLVLMDGKISTGNPLLRGLSAAAQVKAFPVLKDAGLRQWIERRVKAAGGSIAPKAVEMLVRFVGGNLWLMAGEVDKLVLFAGGRRIEEGDVGGVVSYAQEANIFALVDAILEFRAGIAQERLQQLLTQGAVPSYILVMIARQVQLMVRVKVLKSEKLSRGEMQDRLGLTSDFVLRKALEQADRYSPARLREVYHRLLEADISIKTGKYDGELALNILIAELGQGAAG